MNASGNPQQEPDDTPARIVYGLVFDLDAIAAEDGDNLDIDLHYVNAMDITNLNTPVYDVEGAGELLGSIEGVQNGRRVDYDIDMSWAVDAEVPEDGSCGTGTVVVTVAPYTLIATYYACNADCIGNNRSSSNTATACRATRACISLLP